MGQRFAQWLSYVFHPGISPFLCAVFVLGTTPTYVSSEAFIYTASLILISTYILPAIFSVYLVRIGAIGSLRMHNPKDRRYPFLISIAFFLMMANVLRRLEVPAELLMLLLASAFVLVVSYALLRKTKISIHMAGTGGLLALMIHMSWQYEIRLLGWIALAFLLNGLMATARLRLEAHTPLQVLLGFLLGFGSTTTFLLLIR